MHSKDTNYYYSAPNRGAEYCDEGVMCVCVCLSASISLKFFCACYIWLWLGPPLVAL